MNRTGILYAIAASTAFGCGTAIIGVVKRPELVAFTVVGALVTLCLAAGPTNIITSLRKHPRLFLSIGVLDTINIITFYGGLALGPVPLVTALHLTAPLWLILVAVLRRRRPPTWLLASEVIVVVGALVVGAMKPGGDYTASGVVWGSILALMSALALVALNLLVASRAVDHDPATAAGSAVHHCPRAAVSAATSVRQLPCGRHRLADSGWHVWSRAWTHIHLARASATGSVNHDSYRTQ